MAREFDIESAIEVLQKMRNAAWLEGAEATACNAGEADEYTTALSTVVDGLGVALGGLSDIVKQWERDEAATAADLTEEEAYAARQAELNEHNAGRFLCQPE